MRWNSRWSQERRTWWVPKIWPPNHWREGLVAAVTAFLSYQGASTETLDCSLPLPGPRRCQECTAWGMFLTTLKCRTSLDWLELDKLDCECSRLQHPRRRGKANKAQAAKQRNCFVKCSLSRCKWNYSAWWIFANPHDAGIPPNARGSHFDRLTSFRHSNLIQFHLSAKYSTNVSKGFVKSGSHGYDFCFFDGFGMVISVKVLC